MCITLPVFTAGMNVNLSAIEKRSNRCFNIPVTILLMFIIVHASFGYRLFR